MLQGCGFYCYVLLRRWRHLIAISVERRWLPLRSVCPIAHAFTNVCYLLHLVVASILPKRVGRCVVHSTTSLAPKISVPVELLELEATRAHILASCTKLELLVLRVLLLLGRSGGGQQLLHLPTLEVTEAERHPVLLIKCARTLSRYFTLYPFLLSVPMPPPAGQSPGISLPAIQPLHLSAYVPLTSSLWLLSI